MRITALEIKQHEFEKTFRGYDIEEVDIFLNNLSNEWDRISNENKMLRMQLEIAEKEASKLREVEMSLIKTLKSAEETSSKITTQAEKEATHKLADAREKAESTIENAKEEAAQIVALGKSEAEQLLLKAKHESEEILSNAQIKVTEQDEKQLQKAEELKNQIQELQDKQESFKAQLRAIHEQTAPWAQAESIASISQPAEEVTITETPTEEVEEETVKSIASNANNITLDEEVVQNTTQETDDLEIIEGIGPKISELLSTNGISTYKEIATTPSYKIKEILSSAGPHYAMHDPTTWVEQGKLAAEGKWDELEKLKEELIAGRKVADTVQEEAPTAPENATEEMLERVNKVKAALRKAMKEKEAVVTNNDAAAPKESLNDLIAKQREEEGGSFFDNIN